MSRILLLEPNYKNKYPPLGLMKISAYHKDLGDRVIFSKGKLTSNKQLQSIQHWDRIYITTLFTFEWKKTKNIIEYAKTLIDDKERIFIGGITATLMPDEIERETGVKPIIRRLDSKNNEAKERIGYDNNHIIDNYTPDYSILDTIKYDYPYRDAYFAFMTRGCGMNCDFCAVDTLEPDYDPYISIKNQIKDIDKKYGTKKDLLLMDNNVLLSPNFEKIVDEIIDLGYGKEELYLDKKNLKKREGIVDFNQGLDANVLARNEKRAELLSKLEIKPARIAFDHIGDKDVYIKAIKNCVKYGIKSFSNYMLYNADFVNGKGETYKADSPEDLYKRMKITLNLQNEINKNKSDENKIKIYSFPMKYIPLEKKDREYIGTKWNKKFLRAVQVMILPVHGVGSVSEEFFRKSFGEDLEQFNMNIFMPESILMSRGKFLKRDDETEDQWNKKINDDKEANINYSFYEKWISLFKRIKEDNLLGEFTKTIENNSFKYNKFFQVDNKIIKKTYLLYLSSNQFLLLLNKLHFKNENKDLKIVYEFIYKEFNLYYREVIKYISEMNVSSKKIIGFIKMFGEAGIKDIIIYWYKNNHKDDQILDKLKKSMYYVGDYYIDIDKYKAMIRYIDLQCIEGDDLHLAEQYINEFNEKGITRILQKYFDNFKEKLKVNNSNEILYGNIEKKIDILTTELGEQISLF